MNDTETKSVQINKDKDKKLKRLKRYANSTFTTITDKNYKEVIPDFCEAIFGHSLSTDNFPNTETFIAYVDDLKNLLNQLPRPYTIIQEISHVDRSFRDAYYMYFSNQHFKTVRYSRRLSFFKSKITRDKFFSVEGKIQKDIERLFMGSCVINPLSSGVIGRTLINPKNIMNKIDLPVYIRLSKFTIHIYGKKFTVDAFPYRMQDGETMRCAEVTLLNLLEYYSNSYNDYRRIVPSEILDSEQKYTHERVLPSRGINYQVLTKILSEFGFSPRLYNLSSVERFSLSKITPDDELKRFLHYYVESGIPVAVNLMPKGNNASGHSVVCIGHGKKKEELVKKARRNKWISWEHKDTCHPLINSADFYDDYVIIDDNKPVYHVRNFKELSEHTDMVVENIAVPLYKRMFLDAVDVIAIVRSVLHHEHYGIDVWADEFLEPKENVIFRLFMASSHSIKDFRSRTLPDQYAREAYAMIPMPQFVWICELYREKDYEDGLKAFGEIVIDATSVSGAGNSIRSLIMMHYPHVLGVRYPEQSEFEFDDMVALDNDGLFPGFRKNLEKIKSDGTL